MYTNTTLKLSQFIETFVILSDTETTAKENYKQLQKEKHRTNL